MNEKKKLRTARSKAEIIRTIAAVVQLAIAIATLVILIFVHFL